MLQIRLLGQFDVRVDGRRVIIPSRAGQSLLAFLALSVGTLHRREKLAGTFWPETSEENARKNLRQELWRIRKAIAAEQPGPVDYLVGEELTLCFNPDAEYWIDVRQMERSDLDLQSLLSNLSLYQAELLPGFYDDWIVLERERIRAVYETRMELLIGQLVAAERWAAVQEQSERWLSLGDTPEPAFRALMLAYGARGDMAKVASTYQRCTDELRERFGVDPSAETHALYEGLLKGASAPIRSATVQPSGTVTFLFTDMEESTHLLDKLGDQYAAVLAAHHEILRAALQRWNGHEVDTQGDAFFITFARALDAVQCAAEAQRGLAAYQWPHGDAVHVRMGLHTGEPLIASTGYVGMDVHRAARIGDAAHGSQVLLSQSTRDLVLNDLPPGITIRDLGEHRLKDLKYPTPIYQLVMEGLPAEFPPLKTKFSGTDAPIPGEAPFKGLQYFDESDSDLFYGREVLTAKLVNRLRQAQFLSVIVGASGSGKSSLVRAGLIPALKKGAALLDGVHPPEGSANWRVHIITPTAHPLEALARELTRDSESVTATSTLIDDLCKEPRSLGLYLSRRKPAHVSPRGAGHTLLVVDQFEELFTLCRDEFEREAFIDNLLTALSRSPSGENGRSNMTLIVTLRADFYAHLAEYPELRDAVARQQEYIGPMTSEELRRAIEEPARGGHWEFEPGLVDLILRDVGDEPGALPLLSHALLETWKRRAGHTLTLKGYADAGGVRGAIAHTAESVYQGLSASDQALARDLFLRLTELGEGTEDTRRRVSFDELIYGAEQADRVRGVLNTLAEARLVTLGEDTAEVAHEALIREWPVLREWLNEDREGLQLHRRLTEAAHEWEVLGRDEGALYRGAHLAQAWEWAALHPNSLNTGERAFLEASKGLEQREQAEHDARQRRELEAAQKLVAAEKRANSQLRKRALYLAGALVLAVAMAFSALFFGNQARQNAAQADQQRNAAQNAQATAQAEAQSRATQQAIAQANFIRADVLRLAAEANKLLLSPGNDANLATLLSIRSMNTQYTPQGDQALEGAMTLPFPRLVFNGHTADISYADYSPDGRYIVTSSMDKTVRLWDAQTGKEVRQFIGHTDAVMAVAFSPDGKQIATASNDGTVMLWDVQTGKTLQTLSTTLYLEALSFSPDGRTIIFSGYDGTANLLDVHTFQIVRTYTQQGVVYCQDISRDGRYLLTGSKLKAAHLWDVQTGVEVRQFLPPASVRQCAFSPDGKSILTGGEDNIIRMWDIDTGQQVRTFVGHTGELMHLGFSPDGKYILSGAGDGTVRLWNAQTGDQIRALTVPAGTASINNMAAVFSPDEKYIFTAESKTGLLWDMDSVLNTGLPEFITPNDSVYSVAFSPDGKYVLTGSASHNLARLWDVHSRQEIREFCCLSDYVINAVFSPDGKTILTGGGNADNTARVWDIQTGKELIRIEGTSDDYGLLVAFSPDGRDIVTSSNRTILWDAKTGQKVQEFVGHTDRVWALAFSPDGRRLLTGSWDATARVWDVQTGKQLQIFNHPADDGLGAVAFSPDGKSILTGGGDHLLRLWDVATAREIREFTGHTGDISSLTFSADGKYVLSGSADGTARLWDLATGAELRRFVVSAGYANGAVFSPDGKYVLTGDDGGVARIWFIDYHDEIRYLCARLQRDFTGAERTQYGITGTLPTCPGR